MGGITADTHEGTIQVETRKLDDIIPEGLAVNVLKVDSEGADALVLAGAERLLRTHSIRHVFFEHNLTRMMALAISEVEPIDLLNSCGYKDSAIGPGDLYARL